MKRQVLLMVLLSLAFQASAVPVSAEQAKSAARAWVSRGGTLGARLGDAVARATAQTLPNGTTLYAVRMRGGGTLFLSADTEREPVIAFTGEAADDETIDPASPLWALLRRDAEVRASAPVASVAASAAPAAASAAPATPAAARAAGKWATLLAEGAALEDATIARPARTHLSNPGDLRVGPLVQSKWDQDVAAGKTCYNRFTPTLSDGKNAVCGCVATAMAQVMRYHGYPTASVAPVTRKCYVQAASRGRASVTNLTTQAGVYDWANMPLVPADGVTDAQCDAIGKLTSDAGISVCMGYDLGSAGGSGAFMFNVANALTDVFGYASAAYYQAKEVSANAGVLQRAMFSNFDAGFPVLMGISGDGGHAIVGDGYGYNGGTVYVHLNMGWSGQSDYWYNLPDIDTSSGYHFTVFDDLVFNVFPTAASGAPQATLAGRVTDDATNALAGAAVRVYAAGTTTLVTNGVTTANGVYGFLLPVGTYDVEIEKAGRPVERLAAVRADGTVSSKTTLSGWIDQSLDWYETYTDIPVVTSVGNAWGNDAQVVAPRARIVLGAVTNVYATLDKALAAAKALVSAGAPGVQVEVLEAIPLESTAAIDFPCALTAVGTGPAMTPVVRRGNAALAVAAGGTLALSNVTFAAQASTAVTVATGGRLALASGVDFGVPSSVAAVRTATSDGFVLAADLTNGFAIDCDAAPDVNGVFGTAVCDYLVASNCAAKIANVRDTLGETRGIAVSEGGAVLLKWGEIPVPLSESVGYFVDASGATNAAARLDRLFEKFQAMQASGAVGATGEIVIRDGTGAALTRRFAVSGDLTIRGETDGLPFGTLAATAGFDVGANATLNVRGLTFDGYTGDSLFRVVDGGALNLTASELLNLTGTNRYSAAVAVLRGDVSLTDCVISNCTASGRYVNAYGVTKSMAAYGGGVYLEGAGCSLMLSNSTVTACSAATYGGGVYAKAGAAVALAGALNVTGNVSAGFAAADNLHLCESAEKTASLALADAVSGAVGVRWRAQSGTAARAVEGGAFATGEEALLAASAPAFANDGDAALMAAADTAAGALVWAARPTGPQEVDPTVATAAVIPSGGGATRHYGSFADAVASLTGDATVQLLADDALEADVTISNAVTLCSANGDWTLSRFSAQVMTVAADASLTVSNLTLSGGSGTFLRVTGGSLTLQDGAAISDVYGAATRDASAVWVGFGGTFAMESGASITDCMNAYRTAGNTNKVGWGGAVCLEKATAYLRGGTITRCSAWIGGGVMAGNASAVYISGDMRIDGNRQLEEENGVVQEGATDSNLAISDNSRLYLADALSAPVGYTPGVMVSSNVFGFVATNFSGTAAQIANSAHNFTHDLTGDVGFAVTGGGATLLVWSDALDAGGKVTDDGKTYVPVPGGETLKTALADVVTSFVYDGTAKVCLSSDHGYVLTCAAQTNAGTYTATATPKTGFTWEDGTTATRTISWTIAKAVYDMSGVSFADQTFVYDGKPHAIEIAGTLPKGVTVDYTIADAAGNSQPGNSQSAVGVYTVTATFTGDAVNYEPIGSLSATLTIAEKVDPPEPDPPAVTTNYPTPIAFRAITRVSETEWSLEITNRVPWCHYRLLATDDLTKGFVTTGAWEQAAADAAPVWTTNVITTGGAQFWKAEAKEGIVVK